jgi:hypothetical protein
MPLHIPELIIQTEHCKDLHKNICDTKYETQPALTPLFRKVGTTFNRVDCSSLKPALAQIRDERGCFLGFSHMTTMPVVHRCNKCSLVQRHKDEWLDDWYFAVQPRIFLQVKRSFYIFTLYKTLNVLIFLALNRKGNLCTFTDYNWISCHCMFFLLLADIKRNVQIADIEGCMGLPAKMKTLFFPFISKVT